METLQILSIIVTLILGFYSLGKKIKAWLNVFEKTVEEKYQEKADYEALLETIEKLQEAADENAKALGLGAQGTLALLRYRLKEEMTLALARGYTTDTEYEVISGLYAAYKPLGGNHFITHQFEEYNKLKIQKGEKNYD